MNNGEKFPERNARIRALRGTMSDSEIAKECGVTLNVVAGLFFRDDRPWVRPRRERDRQIADAARKAGLSISDIRAIAVQRSASA